jgi:hypothetical protein
MTFAKLWVGDVTKGGLGAVRADAIYTDPPWNPGIARIMRQWADADEGPIDFERFTRVSAMAIAKACPNGPWYVETGPHSAMWRAALGKYSSSPVRVVRASWGSRAKPNHVVCANGAKPIPSGLSGEDTTRAAIIECYPAATILDPFIGKGLTLRHAMPRGVSVLGMELNPKRLAESVKWLSDNHPEVSLHYEE